MRSRVFFILVLIAITTLIGYANANDVTTTLAPGATNPDTLPTAPPAHKIEAKSPNPLCIDDEEEAAIYMLLLIVMLAVCLVATYLLLKFHLHWFPESVLIIGIGIVLGLALTLHPTDFDIITQLDPNIFFQIFLPAIIFDAGYTLEKQPFFGNIGGIIVYAVLGTILSTVVVACGLFLVGVAGISVELPLVDALMFGSLISAVDPVATLAIFSALKVNPILHYLVFGESIVNDAVAIVLFKTFEGFKHAVDSSTEYLVLVGFIQFFYVSIGSVLLGIVMSLLSALFFKHVAVRKYPALELIFFVIFVYGPYLAALPYLSGILTILVSGVVMSYYTAPNLSLTTQATITNGARALAFASEALTFLYVGMALFSFKSLHWSIELICWTILFCLLGRALNVYPLTGILNQFRRSPIDFKTQFIMFFSGLRGAIAFALSIGIKPAGDIGEYLFTTTIIVVLFTIVVFGGGTYPLLKIFKIKTKKEFDDEMELIEKSNNGPKIQNKNILVKWDESFLYRFFVRVDAQAPAVTAGDQMMLRSKFEKLGGRREFDLAAMPGAEHIIVNDRDAVLYDDLHDFNAVGDQSVEPVMQQPSVTIRVDLPRAFNRKRSSSVDYSGRTSGEKLSIDPSAKVDSLVKGLMVDPKKAKIYGEALALHYRRIKNLHDIVDNRYPHEQS
ncbi:vacuolar protein sorting protein VPS44 [Acrasis kona]|uniref:Sodium/hydrogen exchanger n=1 Tax=Acrasis kona TaxID=1008807 RepID=A0AAW2YLA4_9EUKA